MFRSQGEDPPHHHNSFSSSHPPRPNILANETDHHLHHNRSRWKPNVEIAPSCPRCNSLNTKFCYYNNYSLTQPRYFCKGCRRYWTKGGSLRNVPIGGGCRKGRRAKTVRSSSLGTASTSYGVSGNIGSSSCSGISLDDDDQNPDVNGKNTTSTNSSSTNPSLRSSRDPSTIDLALVYAKFLNHDQKQTENYPNNIPLNQHVTPEFCRELDSSVNLPNISQPSKLNAHVQFSHEQNNNNSGGGGCVTGGGVMCCVSDLSSDTQFSEDNQRVMLLNEFDLNYERHQQQQNQQEQMAQERISESTGFEPCSYEVQPLLMPPQELMGQDMFWSNSPLIGSSSFAWQATQLRDLEPVPDDNTAISSNPLDENWSPFDLPSFEALSRP